MRGGREEKASTRAKEDISLQGIYLGHKKAVSEIRAVIINNTGGN